MTRPIQKCPICGKQTFEYISYSEECYGICEQHGYCESCGYTIEQAYSPVYEAFYDIKRGFKDSNEKYHSKNVKRHRRVRKKALKNNYYKGIEINPLWVYYM